MKAEEKPSNPFAYPVTDGTTFVNDGMTLRDHFAGLALSGIMASGHAIPNVQTQFNNIAEDSYRLADAMLKQREQ